MTIYLVVWMAASYTCEGWWKYAPASARPFLSACTRQKNWYRFLTTKQEAADAKVKELGPGRDVLYLEINGIDSKVVDIAWPQYLELRRTP